MWTQVGTWLTSYELGETARCGARRHRNQKHGDGRGESLGVHPFDEATAEEAADNRGEGETPISSQSNWTP